MFERWLSSITSHLGFWIFGWTGYPRISTPWAVLSGGCKPPLVQENYMPPKGAFVIGRSKRRVRRNWARVRAAVRSGAVRRYAYHRAARRSVFGRFMSKKPFRR